MEEFKEEYHFEYCNSDGDCVAFSFEEVNLDAVIEKFGDFLRGCGFAFSGELAMVDDELSEESEKREEIRIDSVFIDAFAEKVEQKIQHDLKSGFCRFDIGKEEIKIGNTTNA